MRVVSVGGGPGGLYAAILLKAADPGRDVVVYERNAPDDTFGFGVVFSAATLSALEDADAASHDLISRATARWDSIDILYRDERIRARGNRFAAISRHELLRILQERCRHLDVDLRFCTEVAGDRLEQELGGADLVLGADGVNSVVRRRFAGEFKPKLTVEGSTFMWLGTTKGYDAFTFLFRDTPQGLFQVHIYPYSEGMSTFIVECTRATRRRAGLDAVDSATLAPGESDHHSIAWLSQLFADHLGGHELVANNSKWLDWTTVTNATWCSANAVLLGDAAHTAHFSIGSGTKLAMEDAIALAAGLQRHPADLAAAVADYESARRPAVERVQAAASDSLDWFARYRRYWHFPPPQFAYSLLTRSERVDYDNLRLRDPGLIGALDRWFAEEASGSQHLVPVVVPPPPALTPCQVGDLRLANRTVAVLPGDGDAVAGHPSAGHLDAVTGLGRSGAGLALVEQVAVAPEARVTPADAGLWDDGHAAAWRKAVEAAKSDGDRTRIAVQLTHAGPRGATRPRREGVDLPLTRDPWPLVAASPLPYTRGGAVPQSLDRAGMARVRDDFAAAAAHAADAGFDLLELQLGHGYLLATFVSPLTNQRDDDYGGDVDARLRFPLEVVDAVRAVWPADRPLAACLTVDDLQPGGIAEDDAVAAAQRLADHGVDLVHAVAGQTTPRARPRYEGAYYSPYSDLVRNRAGVRALGDGDVPGLTDAHHVIAAGLADLVVVGRTPMIEPAWLARHRAADGGSA